MAVDVVHDAHVRGGHASHQAPTGWRAQYGAVPRATRLELVAAARARIAADPSALGAPPEDTTSSEGAGVSRPEPAFSALSLPTSRPPFPPVDDVSDSAVRAGAQTEPSGDSHARTREATANLEHADVVRDEGQARGSAAAAAKAAPARHHPRYDRERVDAFIVESYARLTAKQQAAEIEAPYSYVVMRRMTLARAGAISFSEKAYAREWTATEDAYLREHVGADPFDAIARHLDRSETSVMLRAKRIGIRRGERKANRDGLNAGDIAKILGEDGHFVSRQLIGWGLLKATRHPWLQTPEGPQWVIRREALLDFLIDYPWQYDRGNIHDPFFRRAADEAWSRDPLLTTDEAAAELGLAGGKSFLHLVNRTLPRELRAKIVIRRRGRPGYAGSGGAGHHFYVPRSSMRLIATSGWVNYRAISEDPSRWTVERAAAELWKRADRPPYLRRSVLVNRLRRFFDNGAIATERVNVGVSRAWMLAKPDAVLAMREPLFARINAVLRLTPARRGLVERHDPRWLTDPAELARGLADGRLGELFRVWWAQEQRAAAELRHAGTKTWALVSRHVARVLEDLGPRTKYVGAKHRAIFHSSGACARRLVAIPLVDARRHGLEECGWCAFQRQHPSMKPASRVTQRRGTFVTCSACGEDFRRGRGRPARDPRCPSCALRVAA